jgi:hypothetical protein
MYLFDAPNRGENLSRLSLKICLTLGVNFSCQLIKSHNKNLLIYSSKDERYFATRWRDGDARHGRGRGFAAHGAGRGFYRHTVAGSAAASEMPALNYAFSLFTRKREKAAKRE